MTFFSNGICWKKKELSIRIITTKINHRIQKYIVSFLIVSSYLLSIPDNILSCFQVCISKRNMYATKSFNLDTTMKFRSKLTRSAKCSERLKARNTKPCCGFTPTSTLILLYVHLSNMSLHVLLWHPGYKCRRSACMPQSISCTRQAFLYLFLE